jgi:TPP-dependent pyruvate/acetoin dehydrogenase alpha subunit
MHHGIVPMISVLGESLPVACGVALTMKVRRHPHVVLASCGDGATSTGAFHEAINMASVQKLPLVLLIENNGYAYSTPTSKQFAVAHLSERASSYGIPGERVDGNDVQAVFSAVEQAVERARSGQGPAIIESKTFRVRGHSEADKADYVPRKLREEWQQKDPIAHFEEYLLRECILTDTQRSEIEARIRECVEDAVYFAEHSPEPDSTTVADYVFAPAGLIAIIGEPGADNPRYINALDSRTGQPFTVVSRAQEVVAPR